MLPAEKMEALAKGRNVMTEITEKNKQYSRERGVIYCYRMDGAGSEGRRSWQGTYVDPMVGLKRHPHY